MLFNGEEVGDGTGPGVDVAVDPIDGTRLTSLGQPNALSVIALAERGTMFFPGAAVYMEKVATGPQAAEAIDVTAPPEENVRRVAKAKGVRPEDITVTILDRDRHVGMIDAVRARGRARVPDHRRRRRRRHRGRHATIRGRPAARDRRHARRGDRGRGAEVPRRRDPGAAVAAGRPGARDAAGAGVRPGSRAGDRRPGLGRRGLLRGDRYHRRLPAARREVLARRRHHAFHGDALAFGNGPLRGGRASVPETRTVLGDPVPPVQSQPSGEPQQNARIRLSCATNEPTEGAQWPRRRSSSATHAANPPPKPSRSRPRAGTS